MWQYLLARAEDGFVVVDRPDAGEPGGPGGPGGPVRGWMHFRSSHENGKDVLRVADAGYEDPAALTRLLHFVASLRDQYASAVLALPVDLPLNRLLRKPKSPTAP